MISVMRSRGKTNPARNVKKGDSVVVEVGRYRGPAKVLSVHIKQRRLNLDVILGQGKKHNLTVHVNNVSIP